MWLAGVVIVAAVISEVLELMNSCQGDETINWHKIYVYMCLLKITS
jgi:hypothetical protein